MCLYLPVASLLPWLIASLLPWLIAALPAWAVEPQIEKWELDVRRQVAEDARFKHLAGKHPLVLLHSRARYCRGDYKQSAYSFLVSSRDPARHQNNVQLLFHNGGQPFSFSFNTNTGQQNLLVDLGRGDFQQQVNPRQITIDHPGIVTGQAHAQEGHVYLERVRDDSGNDFYVVLQVVAVDADSRYMAFVWRKLPGGKLVKPRKAPPQPDTP